MMRAVFNISYSGIMWSEQNLIGISGQVLLPLYSGNILDYKKYHQIRFFYA